MELPQLSKTAFQSGTSWHSFKIENSQLTYGLTPLIIRKNLNAFNDSYQVTSDFVSLEDLICFELHLEERPPKQKKKLRRKSKKEDTEIKLKIYSLKVAVSVEDSIMFCNRVLSMKFKEIFAEVFEATELTPYDLFGSPPCELLLLYRQASNQVKDNCIVVDEITLDSQTDILAETQSNVYLEIGCPLRRHPQIKRLTSTINGMSLKSADEVLKDFKVDGLELEMQGPSIFEAYLKFAEAKYIHDVPDWLAACRRSGKTHRKLCYT